MKPAPYLFSGPNSLYGVFRGKIVPDENIAQFCLKSPHEFYGLNELDGAIGGKSVPVRSFVLPKKHVFDLNFCTKSHLTYFLGQTD